MAKEQLAYCTNVHPGETVDALLQNIEQFVEPVRRKRQLDQMATGIWLSARAVEELQVERNLETLKSGLRKARLWPTSINGFPFGNFHEERVKEAVYRPGWCDSSRREYSEGLGRIAVHLLARAPERFRKCAISTVPLGFAGDWKPDDTQKAIEHLISCAHAYRELSQNTGVALSLCLEMEPGCVLERTGQVLDFWEELRLHAAATDRGAALGHLGLCYDICHQAVQFEDIRRSLEALESFGVPIKKFQISSAIEVHEKRDPASSALWESSSSSVPPRLPEESTYGSGRTGSSSDVHPSESDLTERLRPFCDERYLHQTNIANERNPGSSRSFLDLDQALAFARDSGSAEDRRWRIHYHVPIHLEHLSGPLYTTQASILETLKFLASSESNAEAILEVETYTWSVLPESIRKRYENVVDAIIMELEWLEAQIDVIWQRSDAAKGVEVSSASPNE
jgi:hypothetical protein